MNVAVELFSLSSPNPSLSLNTPLKRASTALRYSSSLRFKSLLRPHTCTQSIVRCNVAPRGLGLRFLPLNSSSLRNQSLVSFAASHEESKHSEIDVERKNDFELEAKESEEVWKKTLESFKEQALKMQSVSQEAYVVYSKKTMVVLSEISENLKIQADRARSDLSAIAEDIADSGQEYLTGAVEKYPEPVKDVVTTFASSADDLREISKVRDFYLGIPYGLLLSLGGFLSFMLTGSISGIRFGVILGTALLALSILSLKSWKRGESFALALKGQAVISGIIFLREVRLLSQRASIFGFLATIISGAMLAFYVYRITLNGDLPNGLNLRQETED